MSRVRTISRASNSTMSEEMSSCRAKKSPCRRPHNSASIAEDGPMFIAKPPIQAPSEFLIKPPAAAFDFVAEPSVFSLKADGGGGDHSDSAIGTFNWAFK